MQAEIKDAYWKLFGTSDHQTRQARGTRADLPGPGRVYSDGGARGAPDAVQVADRWHLWHNLGEATERAVSRHREHLPAGTAPQVQAAGATAEPDPPPPGPRPARTGKIAGRTWARHAGVHQMLAGGSRIREIAAALSPSRNTVRRFARAANPDELLVHDGTGKRDSILDEHAAYLRERWNAGCTNAAQLWQELRDRGYPGGPTPSASTSPATAQTPLLLFGSRPRRRSGP